MIFVHYALLCGLTCNWFQQKIFDDPNNNIRPQYVDGGPGCFGDSGGPLWRQVIDEKTKTEVPVLVGVFSYLLWGTCHGTQEPKYYGQVTSIKDWINQYVPLEQTCEFSSLLTDHSKWYFQYSINVSSF